MTVGYVLDHALGFSLALAAILAQHLFPRGSSHTLRLIMPRIVDAYHSSAILLALSIQLASIVVLGRTDFGHSAGEMGDVTVKLTWTTSVLTLFPLLYCTFTPRLGYYSRNNSDCTCCEQAHDQQAKTEAYRRGNLRLYLFILCWMLSLYPFLSRMIQTYGPSKIGEGGGTVISTSDYTIIWQLCNEGVIPVTSRETQAINASGIMSWAVISMFAIAAMVGLGVKRNHPDSRLRRRIDRAFLLPVRDHTGRRRTTPTALVAIFVVPILSILQIWAYFRLQRYQEDMSNSTKSGNSDLEWGFGQIVAVTVFVPILVETWYGSRKWYIEMDSNAS